MDSMSKRPQPPIVGAVPKKNALMDIPEAAVEMCTTVFAIRQLCRSGMLRYSQPGHPFLISPDAIQDCIRLMEENVKAKREAKLARKLAHVRVARLPHLCGVRERETASART